MNNRFLNIFTIIASSTLFLAGCDGDSPYAVSNTGIATNPGVISQKNFSLLTADIAPAVIDVTNSTFTKTDVELTVYIGDRKNQTLTDAHTIYFETEYGLIEPSCVTENGSCSVMWSAIASPDPGGPGSDGFVTITAYTTGEEGFTDTNGNNLFDDGDTGFNDLEEPFVDTDESNTFTAGDAIIDVVSTTDPFGTNKLHDLADGFFNGAGCTHSFLCSPRQSITVFDDVTMSIFANVPLSRTIGGSVTGLTGSGLVLQNNLGDDYAVAANGPYTFATPIIDGSTYNVSVLTQPTTPAQVCTVANNTGTVSANVTNADVTCVTTTYTIGGNVTGLDPASSGVVLQNNAGDNLTINANGTFTFATPINDGATYNVSVLTQPTVPGQVCTATTNTGTATADVTTVNVNCVTNTFTVGGNVTGIPGGESIIIQNNGGDNLTVNVDGPFTFTTPIDDLTGFAVTVLTPPPSAPTCTFTAGTDTGTISNANETGVTINCI